MSYIVVIGSINMDLVVKTERMPKPGETVKGETFNTIPGGKGANQAIAARRMGAQVKMIGAIGDDTFGLELKNSLVENGVDVTGVIEKLGISTGTATIIVDRTGDNQIIVVPGANGTIFQEDIDKIEHLIADASIVVLQFEIPLIDRWVCNPCCQPPLGSCNAQPSTCLCCCRWIFESNSILDCQRKRS